jgi:hypoxanthine phosphoribosyltransferase
MNGIQILPVIGASISIIGFFITLYISMKKIHESKKKESIFLIQDKQIKDNRLLPLATNEAIFELASFARSIKPDYIIGLNRGGVMIGAFLSLGLGIPRNNFIKFYAEPRNNEIESEIQEGKIPEIRGIVLVVDDMCRTGDTMRMVFRYLNSMEKIIKIYTASLVTAVEEYLVPTYHDLHHYSLATKNKNLLLPWAYEIRPDDIAIKREQFRKVRSQSVESLALEVSENLYQT